MIIDFLVKTAIILLEVDKFVKLVIASSYIVDGRYRGQKMTSYPGNRTLPHRDEGQRQ